MTCKSQGTIGNDLERQEVEVREWEYMSIDNDKVKADHESK